MMKVADELNWIPASELADRYKVVKLIINWSN